MGNIGTSSGINKGSVLQLVELRRSSDNATEDFYPDGDDILSLTSERSEGVTLATWVGANDAYVRTAYDQTGNAAGGCCY